MSDYIITNSWEDITPVCCYRHEKPIPMVIQEGPSSPFYACPKYHEENREPGERACNNRISIQDYTKMLSYLHNKMVEASLNDELLNLTNYSWKDRKGIEYKVLSQNNDKCIISVYNKRAVNS